jgi:NADPH2:quinone reductase
MGNFSVLGVMLGYSEMPIEFRKFGVNTFPREVGREVHGALLELVATGTIRPVIGRRISMHEVAGALDDHEQRRTSGRTVVDISRG